MNLPQKEPVAEQPYLADDVTPTSWAEARRRLADADTYWLATVRSDGRPHLVPVLAVWLDDALHFVASRTSRKARNLAHDAHCVIAASRDALDLVVEGEATKVTGEARLRRVAEVYMTKYGWPVTVRDGAFYGDGAPTAGPPPYDVYEVVPTTAFGFPTEEETFSPTRWRF
jgi:nitroimidazol reductase NimA-like FMN-containing flavoprotein (pyridoxamine 5'-phosphate oxidase superfamily)